MKYLMLGAAALALTACAAENKEAEAAVEEAAETVVETVEVAAPEPATSGITVAPKERQLELILAAQPEEVQARYDARNPYETLLFLGIEPGMNVAEILPGGGWYSKLLLPYLGEKGTLHGVDYDIEMWPLFGGFATEEFLEARKTWAETWSAQAEEWRSPASASLNAFTISTAPAEAAGTLDAVLMVRAYHHFNRFEDQGGYATAALEEIMTLLKPGGIVGVVQHRAPEGNSDEWANGDNGYVKQSEVIADFEAAGFELVEASEINANPKDQPTEEDMVWRLPPTLGTSGEDEELRAQMMEIGETDRMTLKFRKPA
ncbi:class I SAM-dependent methyltransferase [Parvularcula sp. IMCC14364]|uniref:class I SAM-dependent methyltransferase n=1 Tax=Parvularcula sp. IMCC14364 TaxID=3067902 RepID=UPI002741F12B|nr:hypothetical protein [Parvularcula sp. IMCC14364]